jgi:hypothetical protein
MVCGYTYDADKKYRIPSYTYDADKKNIPMYISVVLNLLYSVVSLLYDYYEVPTYNKFSPIRLLWEKVTYSPFL